MRSSWRALPVAAVFLLACGPRASAPPVTPQYFAPPPRPDGSRAPFSAAVRAGDFLFVAGQVGAPPGTFDIVPGGIEAEARQALDNLKAILERHGSSLDHVVQCNVYLTDMAEWPAFNTVYLQYFTRNLPARSALGAAALVRGARVEVDCVAVVASGQD